MKRYDCTDSGSTYESFGAPIMQESITGEWVKVSDLESLVLAMESTQFIEPNANEHAYNQAIRYCIKLIKKSLESK